MEGNNTNREIENRKRRNLLTLFFIVLFYGFGEGTFFIVYQPFLLDITGSIFLTGVLITVFSIVQFLPAPFTGKISDKIGRKKMMLIDTPTRILGLFLLTVSNNVVLVTIGLICFFLAGVIGMSSFQILLSESSNDSKKGLMVGLIFFALFAGGIVGKFFIIVNKGFDARFYFFLFLVIEMINWAIIAGVLKDVKTKNNLKKIKKVRSTLSEQSLWSKMIKTPKFRVAIIFFTLDVFIWSISGAVFIAGLRDQLGLTNNDIAFISIWFSIANMIFQIPGGHLADRIGRKKSLVLSQCFGLVYFSLNIVAYFYWTMALVPIMILLLSLGQFFVGISVSTFIPSEQMSLTNLDENRKAESYGVVTFIRGLGIIPTGIIAGFLIDYIHFLAPFFITLGGIIIEIWFLIKYFED